MADGGTMVVVATAKKKGPTGIRAVDRQANAAALRAFVEAHAGMKGTLFLGPYIRGLLLTLADVEATGRDKDIAAATERLRFAIVEAPADGLDELRGRTVEACAIADELVKRANASWEKGTIDVWLEATVEGAQPKHRHTRRRLAFLRALDAARAFRDDRQLRAAAGSRCVSNVAPEDVVYVRLYAFDPAASSRVTKALIDTALAAWVLGSGQRSKWSKLAKVAKAILGGHVDGDDLEKAWTNRPKPASAKPAKTKPRKGPAARNSSA